MKKLVILLISTIWTSFSLLGQQVIVDQVDKQAQYVSHLTDRTQADILLKESLRLYFIDKDNKYPNTAKNIAQLFLNQEDYQHSVEYLDNYFFLLSKDDPERTEIAIAKAKIYLLSNKPKKALVELLQVRDKKSDRLGYYKSLAYLLTDKFDKAEKQISTLAYLSTKETKEINQQLSKLRKNHKKNPKSAKIYSAILPGLGQVLNGEVVDGIKSFVLLGTIAVIAFELSATLSITDIALAVGPWYGRYFLGGIDNAEIAAASNKVTKKNLYISNILSTIEQSVMQVPSERR